MVDVVRVTPAELVELTALKARIAELTAQIAQQQCELDGMEEALRAIITGKAIK